MYEPLQRKTLIVLVLWLLAACSRAEPISTPTPESITPGTRIPLLADEELAEAIRQAQETLHIWREEFLAPKKSYSMASLKVRFITGENVEDMWTEPLYILGDTYTVRMVEGVTLDKGIHPDRLLDVKAEDIIDWMLLEEDGTLLGGYTLRLEYKRMTPEQQKRYIEITGIRFDKPE
jgi:uncharacterized protein YegJ (DUF2314 family)